MQSNDTLRVEEIWQYDRYYYYAVCHMCFGFFSVWNFSSSVCTIELGAVFSFEVQNFWRFLNQDLLNRVSGVNWKWFCKNHQELEDNKKRNLSQKSLQSFRKIGTKCLERQKYYTNTAIKKPVPAALRSI